MWQPIPCLLNPWLAVVQTSGSVALNTKNIFCLCNYSYRDYILYMKYLFSQSVSVFLFISTLRQRCQTSTKHLFKPAALLRCWESASCGPCCHSAAVESLFEARHPLVKVETLVSLSFCCVEHLKHAHCNVNRMSCLVQTKPEKRISAAWEYTVWC